MADRYLLESGAPDGYLLEDGTGVFLLDASPGYLLGSSSASSFASTPDIAAYDPVSGGTFRLIVLVDLNDWTPAATNILFAKDVGSGAERSYSFGFYSSTTNFGVEWRESDDTIRSADATGSPAFTPGIPIWVSIDVDLNNGAGGATTAFDTSTDPIETDPGLVSWSTYGTDQTSAGTSNVKQTTSKLTIGNFDGGLNRATIGKVYYAELIVDGVTVANADFRYDCQQDSSTQLTDDQGRVWTVSSPATWVNPMACPDVNTVVTPAVIAVTVTVPTPVAAAASLVTPAVVAPTVTLPTPVAVASGLFLVHYPSSVVSNAGGWDTGPTPGGNVAAALDEGSDYITVTV